MLILKGAILKNHQMLKLPLDEQLLGLYSMLIQCNYKIRKHYGVRIPDKTSKSLSFSPIMLKKVIGTILFLKRINSTTVIGFNSSYNWAVRTSNDDR